MSQICRYYQRGTCKYGNSCHFLHENNYYSRGRDYSDYSYSNNYKSNNYHNTENHSSYRNHDRNRDSYSSYDYSQNYSKNYNRYHVDHRQPNPEPEIKSNGELSLSQFYEVVRAKVKQLEDRHVWPLTVIEPIKSFGNIPGFDDYSPEEIRYQFYVASCNNSLHEYKRTMDELKAKVFQLCSEFKNKSSISYNIVKEMMNQSPSHNESQVSSVFQTPLPSTNFSFRTKPAIQQNAFPTNSVFNNAAPFPQNNFSFGNTNNVQAEWNNQTSFSNQSLPAGSQINTFSFKSNKSNEPPSYPFPSKSNIPQDETDPNYSKLGDLTPEYLQAFQGKTFKYGHIPLMPPPKELCY